MSNIDKQALRTDMLIVNALETAKQLRELQESPVAESIFESIVENENGKEIQFERPISDLAYAAFLKIESLVEALEAAERSIAELERSETQLINERDAAESALADMYQAATGERPEWSNMFGFADAVDVVEERLATLEANQSQTTPTGIQLITEAIGAHGYIVGCLLQGRPDLALEESRKWVSAFGQAAEIVSAQDAAGIGVKGE
ncbi:TPA: hypothetical protein ACIT5E_000637 [Salmonella enterica subsp. enterica serovar Virchow]